MKQCTGCRRHVRPAERGCPFCGEVLHVGEAPRLGAVVLLGALGAACVLGPSNDTASGESSGESVGASTTSETGVTTSGASTGAGANTTGTTSAGELTSSNDVDSGDSGCSFYGGCPRDGGTSTKECDQWMQDCPDGEKCMPYSGDGDNSWDSLKCVPVARNPGKPGDPCMVEGSGVSGIDDCELGAMCWDVDSETMQGTCVAQCSGAPDQPMCADPETACLNSNDGVLTLCLPKCDPLLQDCSDGNACLPNPQDPNSFLCVLDASGDEGQEFDVCEYSNGCDAGFLCGNPALATECDPQGAGCCVAFCDLTMPQCTGEGAGCLPWFGEDQVAPPGLEDVGVCGIPQ